jgi:hypothetical protein
MRSFVSACTDVLTNDQAAFTQSYIYALKVWMALMILKTAVGREFQIKPKRHAAAWLPARLSRMSALPSRER